MKLRDSSTCRRKLTNRKIRTSTGWPTAIRAFLTDSMARNPLFTVVLATYGRGVHIKPTIESVLDQSFPDFELIVAGDGCADQTESVVRSFADDRLKWCNLPHNTGSQSFPNNEGILHARGNWICYLGHDDIWAPDHLAIL